MYMYTLCPSSGEIRYEFMLLSELQAGFSSDHVMHINVSFDYPRFIEIQSSSIQATTLSF